MAGTQGMGSPKQVIPSQPVAAQPPEVDYAAMAQSFTPEPTQEAEVDYAALAANFNPDQATAEAPEQGFLDNVWNSGSPMEKSIAKLPLQVLEYAGKKITGTAAGIGDEVANAFDGKDADVGSGAIKGFLNPESVPALSKSFERIAPITKEKLKAPVTNLQDYAEARAGNENYEAVITNKSVDTIPASEALAFFAEVEAGNLAIKGLTKIVALGKLGVKAISPAKEALDASKISKVESAVDPVVAAAKDIQSVKDAAASLEELGTKIPLTPRMANGASAEAKATANFVKDNKVYQDVEEEIGNRIVKLANETIPQQFSNIHNTNTTDDILDIVTGVGKKSGGKIGELKAQAAKELGGNKILAPEFKSKVDELVDSLTTADTQSALYLEEGSKKKELVDFLNKAHQDLFNNPDGMTFAEYENFYKTVSKRAQETWNSNAETKFAWSNMRSKLSLDQNGMMSEGLKVVNPQASAAFVDAKSGYTTYMDSQHDLKTFLKKDSVTGNALMKSLSSDTAATADKVNSMINVLGVESPEAVKDFRNLYYNYQAEKFKFKPTTENPFGMDFDGFAKHLEGMAGMKTTTSNGKRGTNLLDLMSGSEKDSKNLLDMAKVMKSFANSYSGRGDIIVKETLFGRMLYYGSKVSKADGKSLISPILDAIQRDKKLSEVFNSMDLAEVVKGFPPTERDAAMKYVKKVLKK